MFAAFTDEQRELRGHVRTALAELCPPSVLRAAWSDRGVVSSLWAKLVDLGLLGVMVGNENGGLGLDARDAVTLAEECGYVGLPGPYVDSAWVAAPALEQAGTAPELLQALLSGAQRIVVRNATSPLVADANLADHVLVLTDDRATLQGIGATGLASERGVDGARVPFRFSDEGSGLPLPEAAAAFNRGALGSAAFQLGLARRMLDLSVAYARVREQFGRPIGSYQAVQHPLADTSVALSFAAPLAWRAAWSLAVGHPDASIHVSMAHLRASAAAHAAGRAALQVHGAIGYTTEHDLHLYLKRAWALQRAWGDASFHRRRIAVGLERHADAKEYWDA